MVFLSGVAMFIIADICLFRFFLPIRYIEYSVPLLKLILFSLAVDWVFTLVSAGHVKKTLYVVIIVLILCQIKLRIDYPDGWGKNKRLYEFLRTLPKSAMIAAPPLLADGIPTFAQRKVFINYELSNPIYRTYWRQIKKGPMIFLMLIIRALFQISMNFLKKNSIDYLVIDKGYYDKERCSGKKYFEPFQSYIEKLKAERNRFALREDIPESAVLFEEGDIFVISTDCLKNLEKRGILRDARRTSQHITAVAVASDLI